MSSNTWELGEVAPANGVQSDMCGIKQVQGLTQYMQVL